MLKKRIIPCLDVKDGRTVKGINFNNLRDAGDAIELAKKYAELGADELVFLDISATQEKRKTLTELVKRIAAAINIPFTVGGGIANVAEARLVLESGADKIVVNSAAVRRPELINELSVQFGNQCIVLAIDAKREDNSWKVYTSGGKTATEKTLFSWAAEAERRGAGEILFTSMNHDGTKNGFANTALAQLSETVSVPIIASGGAGTLEDFSDAFLVGKADAALAASVFHYQEIEIPILKQFLNEKEISIRLCI